MTTKKIQKKIQAQGLARAEVEKVPKANHQNPKLRFLNLKPHQKVEIKCDLFLHASLKIYSRHFTLLMHEIK